MAKPYFSKEPYAVTIIGDGGGTGGGGMRFISGEGAPGTDVGTPGDVYLDTATGDLYMNKNGTWTLEMNLKGPKGDKGDKGDPGPAGKDGADGFPTKAEWDALVARVEALEGGGA